MPDNYDLLLVTTQEDPSAAFLAAPGQYAHVTVIYYDTPPETLRTVLAAGFDAVYFRDPFNDSAIPLQTALATVALVAAICPNAYYVDGVTSYAGLEFEDKWLQFEAFPDCMPQTEVLTSFDSVDFTDHFVKQRISSRARGIIFSDADIPPSAEPSDYIIQAKLEITHEYRVCMIGNEILRPFAVKRSKADGQQVKITGLADDDSDMIRMLCKRVYARTGYDLMGLDIARTPDGYLLLEVNRSCQFKAFQHLSGIDMADMLYRLVGVKLSDSP